MRGVTLCLAAAFLASCGETATEPQPMETEDLYILNSTGQTFAGYSVREGISASGQPVDLGAGFDGDAFDVGRDYAVTSVSSFGGSRVLFVDLNSGVLTSTGFPEPEADLANPSAPFMEEDGTTWIGGRGSDAVYRVRPGDAEAERIAEEVGTFVERVVPVGDRLYVVDANIDDDGGTYRPNGPGRIIVLSRSGQREGEIELPASAMNPTDAIEAGGRLLVMAAGTFDPVSFLPLNDGVLVILDPATGVVGQPLPLVANGVSLELGADGYVYLTTTTDYQTLQLLRFDAITGVFLRGPADPILVRDAAGEAVNCWSATALAEGQIVCATFRFEQAGRVLLAQPDGTYLDEAVGGFGTTDIALAPPP